METYQIEITNELPLEIEAELIYEEDNEYINNREQNRYHSLAIYKSVDDKGEYYVVNILYNTLWQGERSISEIWESETKEGIKTILDGYNPVLHVVGFPDGERYEQKQEKLLQSLTFDWNELKIRCLTNLGFKRKGRLGKRLKA